jgi:hypothetical protein
MHKIAVCLLVFGIVNVTYAQETVEKLRQVLDLGTGEMELSCHRDSTVRDVFGNTSFIRDKCPYVRPTEFEVVQTQGIGDASKGNITYHFNCVLRIREYNYGVLTKTKDEHPHGSVSAEYLFAFGDIAIRNVRSTAGSQLCAAPIADKISSLNRQ